MKRRLADRLRVGEVDISRGQLATLDEAQLHDAPFADDPVKGAGLNLAVARWSLGVGGTYQSIFDSPSRESLFPATGMLGLEAQLHNFFRRDWIWAFDLALGSAAGQVDLSTGGQVPFHFSEIGLGTSMLVEWPHQRLTPFVGARLALLLMNRTFDDPTLPDAALLHAVAGHRRRAQAAPLRRPRPGRARAHSLLALQRR